MRRRLGLLALPPSIFVLALVGTAPANAAEGGSPVACTQSATTTTTTPAGVEGPPTSPPAGPSPGRPCWVDVDPYPFGSEGIPVETPAQPCSFVFKGEAPPGSQCALTVTSLAFRAWNRGLAATTTSEAPANNPYGVWLFNGASWFPSPGFPGYSVCPGHTVVWAGKLDYWLIGGPSDLSWSRLCRFDGTTLEWESLELPAATKQHVTVVANGEERRRPGGITSAGCLAWNDCWLFGAYGTVVHWDGTRLSDASPDPSLKWLQGEYTAAVARQDPLGDPFGVAVGGTTEFHGAASTSEVLPEHEGAAPPEMQASSGGAFAPVGFTPPTNPQAGDPYRTDLVAVDFDAAGQGWVAGNPAGLRITSRHEFPPASPPLAPLSPLVPVTTSGASTTCAGPPRGRFTFMPPLFKAVEPPNSFLWSQVAVVPGADEALAGGSLLPHEEGTTVRDPNARPEDEPVIAQAACDGTTTVTRFRVEDPTYKGSLPKPPLVSADREGYVSAIAANANNDAWAATSMGSVFDEAGNSVPQPPHLYRLTDGAKPDAPEGDDLEQRPLELELDPPIIVLEPPPPAPAEPAPTTVTQTRKVKLPPAIFAVKAKLHKDKHGLSLYLSFRVRRPVTLGAQALRHGHVVSEARARRFTGHRGLLILELDRKRWPTKVRFVA